MENNSALHIKTVITGVIAALTAFWGWFGWLVIIWVGLMLADWLVGSAVASKEGRWSSAKLREGAWHKGGMIVIVCVALVADWLIGMMTRNLPGIALPFTYTVLIGPLVIVRHWGTGQSGGARRPHGRAGPGMAAENPGRWQVRRGCRR